MGTKKKHGRMERATLSLAHKALASVFVSFSLALFFFSIFF